jgi:hypothetical protein
LNNQKQNAETEEKIQAKRWLLNILWLTPAFVPAIITLYGRKEIDWMPSKWFWILNGICSLIAGIGFWRGITTKRLADRIAGVGTGVVIFALNLTFVALIVAGLMLINLVIAFYQGCCSGHF